MGNNLKADSFSGIINEHDNVNMQDESENMIKKFFESFPGNNKERTEKCKKC